VAGSSVIYTDPIFQGMAISLSSGVLVSTVLTLIVIPLGCVAASRDLCEVAVASAPAGTTVPCAEELLEDSKTATAHPPRQREPSPALAKVGSALMMAFYLVRGIFLLLFDWLKTLWRKYRRRGPGRPGGGSGGGAGGSGGVGAGGVAYDQGSRAAAEVRNALRTGGETRAEPDEVAREAPPEVAGETAPTAAPKAPKQTSSQAPTATGEAGSAEAADAAAGDAKVGAAAPKPAPQSMPKATPTATPKSTDAKPQARKQPAKKKAAAKTAATTTAKVAKVQKKAARRGIRLKTEDADQDTFE